MKKNTVTKDAMIRDYRAIKAAAAAARSKRDPELLKLQQALAADGITAEFYNDADTFTQEAAREAMAYQSWRDGRRGARLDYDEVTQYPDFKNYGGEPLLIANDTGWWDWDDKADTYAIFALAATLKRHGYPDAKTRVGDYTIVIPTAQFFTDGEAEAAKAKAEAEALAAADRITYLTFKAHAAASAAREAASRALLRADGGDLDAALDGAQDDLADATKEADHAREAAEAADAIVTKNKGHLSEATEAKAAKIKEAYNNAKSAQAAAKAAVDDLYKQAKAAK